jgi:hypothetical protein
VCTAQTTAGFRVRPLWSQREEWHQYIQVFAGLADNISVSKRVVGNPKEPTGNQVNASANGSPRGRNAARK